MIKTFKVLAHGDVPVTAGNITEYAIAREVADGMSAQYRMRCDILDGETGKTLYTIEPFAENVIPIRPGVRPQGVEHGPERE